jgi:hypothetical protein
MSRRLLPAQRRTIVFRGQENPVAGEAQGLREEPRRIASVADGVGNWFGKRAGAAMNTKSLSTQYRVRSTPGIDRSGW